jgi:hypothetical protein
MHDFLVETVFPHKKAPAGRPVSPEVKNAVKKAAERVKSFKKNWHYRSISNIVKSHQPNQSITGEIRDVIYLP